MSTSKTHPSQLALRTYALALSLSLGPALVPFVTKLVGRKSVDWAKLRRILRRELGYDGFASSMTLAVTGGAILKDFWKRFKAKDQADDDKYPSWLSKLKTLLINLSPEQETFFAHSISASLAFVLLQSGASRTTRLRIAHGNAKTPRNTDTSLTLDLTLILLVRALDSLVQGIIIKKTTSGEGSSNGHAVSQSDIPPKEQSKKDKEARYRWTSRIDAFVFWACSARIMWCFFYEPYRLPRSYVKWIQSLSNLDSRFITTLQRIRSGEWSYTHGASSPSSSLLLQTVAQDLGYPPTWGDPSILPSYSGPQATEIWKTLGVRGRDGIGGVPCELLHGDIHLFGFGMRKLGCGLERSCTSNALFVLLKSFMDALMIYGPVHLVPILLFRPSSLLSPSQFTSLRTLIHTLTPPLRSSLFLSSFISTFWYTVCLTRTLLLPKLGILLLPKLGTLLPLEISPSHNFYDGPYGCALFGSLICGSSIWVEDGKKRGEMMLYVLPRAVRTVVDLLEGVSLPLFGNGRGKATRRWQPIGVGKMVEKVMFVVSFAVLMTAARYRPETLRGLSKWTLGFVLDGPDVRVWKKWVRRTGENMKAVNGSAGQGNGTVGGELGVEGAEMKEIVGKDKQKHACNGHGNGSTTAPLVETNGQYY